MPYPPERRRQTRARIIRSAQALFNRHGFTDVSIDEVMKHAGLTRGGFYSYFRTKSELYAEAIALALAVTPWSRWDGVSVDFAARDAARQVVDAYLSREHFGDIEGSCPMVTLPGDVAHQRVRRRRTVNPFGGAANKTMTSASGRCFDRVAQMQLPRRDMAHSVVSLHGINSTAIEG